MTETTSKSVTSHQVDKVKLFKSLSRVVGFLVVAATVITVTTQRLESLGAVKAYQQQQNELRIATAKSKQLDCLAKNIYWEAGSEPYEGKVAVAQVTLNRVNSGKFADSVCGVVYQKNVVLQKVVCQFSWFCDGKMRDGNMNPTRFEESYAVARKVLLGGVRLPELKDALYYHADYVNPRWKNLDKIHKVGAHIFYKERSQDL
jgi:spore germination cell wall hydrolase CwlJ-like protein